MGCSPSSNSSGKGDKENSLQSLTVQIVNPQNQQIIELKYNSLNNKREDYLMNVMNTLFFADDQNQKIDVCFNSLHSKKDDRYHYYLYRLLNIEMENIQNPYQGKMWVLYIQNKPTDWDQVVNTNLKYDFTKGGKVIWRYEKFSLASSDHMNIQHQLSQENNLDYLKDLIKNSNQVSNDSQINIHQTQCKTLSNQQIQNIMQDKSTADHTQVSSLKGVIQENDEISKKKVKGNQDAPSSIFNPQIQDHPNAKKLLVTESSNIYKNNVNFLNTEDEGRVLQPPLQTEAYGGENSDYRNVFETQQNDDSVNPDKTLFQSFNGTRKSQQVPNSSNQHRNSNLLKELALTTQQSDKKRDQKYLEGEENIKSEKQTFRKNHINQGDMQKNMLTSNSLSYKFQENCEYNLTKELINQPK